MVNPKLSVIIASYNHQDYIARTLESLEKQTFQNFEIILIDDGSTDKTVEVARNFHSRAQIFTQQNQGVVAARNQGVSLAKGKYICLVDSDDIVLPNRFEKQVAALENDIQFSLVFADALIIDSNGNNIGKFSDVYPVKSGDTAEMLIRHYCFTPNISVMVRTSVLKQTGLFQKPGPTSEYMKWIEIAHLGKTYYDPEPLGCWRRHQESVSKQADKEKSYAGTRIALRKIVNKYPELKEKTKHALIKRFSRSYFLTGFFLAADGNISRARKYYYKAIKTYPASLENIAAVMLISIPSKKLIQKLHSLVKAKKLPW